MEYGFFFFKIPFPVLRMDFQFRMKNEISFCF